MRGETHCLTVWGELACFTRPEMKVERYSYPIITHIVTVFSPTPKKIQLDTEQRI